MRYDEHPEDDSIPPLKVWLVGFGLCFLGVAPVIAAFCFFAMAARA